MEGIELKGEKIYGDATWREFGLNIRKFKKKKLIGKVKIIDGEKVFCPADWVYSYCIDDLEEIIRLIKK